MPAIRVLLSLWALTGCGTGLAAAFAPIHTGPQRQQQRHHHSSTSFRAASTKESNSSWEDETIDVEDPLFASTTDLETFLSKKFPEFFYLLQKNEAVWKDVITQSSSDSTSGGGVTLFVPNAQAFEALGTKRLEQLQDERNLEMVEKMAAYHVVATEAVPTTRLFTEDWTQGRPAAGEQPNFVIQGIATEGGTVPVSRGTANEGFLGTGWGATPNKRGSGTVGTNNAQIVQSFTGKQSQWIVHEMNGFVSPELLWRFCDQLRIPGF